MLLLSNLICIHIIHPGGTPIRGKNADLTFTEWSCSFSLSFHPSHLCLVFRAIPILSINLISFPPFGYDSWLSYCGLSFSFFSLFCSFLYLWKWLFKFWYASKKAYPGRQTTNQSQLTICPSFFSFLLPFSFFSFFPFFLLLLPFFCPTGEKKRSFFFFLSCSCSGPKPGRSGEQWQTCRRQPGPSAFCLYLSKGFCFCSSILFSLTVLKSKNDSPSTWPLLQSDSSAFFSTSFFLGCSSLDFWIFCPSAVETGSQYSWWYVVLPVFHTLTPCAFLL